MLGLMPHSFQQQVVVLFFRPLCFGSSFSRFSTRFSLSAYSDLDFSFFSRYESTQLHRRGRLRCGNLANSICQGIHVPFFSPVWLLMAIPQPRYEPSTILFLSLAISWRILGGAFQACQGTCHRDCSV